MKRTSIIWYILGGLALIALGFVAGYALNGGFMTRAAWAGGLPFRAVRGAMMPGLFMGGLRFGLGWLLMLVFALGPIAGILALILVLTRKPVVQVAPPVEPVPSTPAVAETAQAKKK